MQTQGKELSTLDFYNIIGGPLTAVVKAQAQAAIATADFIQKVGFKDDNPGSPLSPPGGQTNTQTVRTVEFDYSHTMRNLGGTDGLFSDDAKITVPLLAMVPIPFIRVDSMTIDLNVNLHSVDKQTTDNNFAADTSMSESGGLPWLDNVNIQATVSERNTYQRDQTTDDTYSLHVTVHAVQDQVPAGLSQVLSMFSNLVSQQAQMAQALMTLEMTERMKQLQEKQSYLLQSPPSPP